MAGWLARTLDRAIGSAAGAVLRRMVGGNGHAQSVDELISILQGETSGAGISKQLSASAAQAAFYRWQYAAATAIADAVMLVERFVEVKEADKKGGVQWVRNDEHDLARVLAEPNPYMTGPELTWLAVCECMMIGQSWWLIVRNGVEEIAELWPIMGTMKPDLASGGAMLQGWTQTLFTEHGVKTNHYDPDEIVYMRLPKPQDFWGGFGPMQAAGASIQLDDQIVTSEWAAFKNGLFPFAVVYFSEKDPKKRDRMMEEFRDKYASADKTGKAIGVSESMDVKFPQAKLRDMGYKAGSEQTKDGILGTMRVPAAILGDSKQVNRSSAEGMEYIFAKWRIAPLLVLLGARQNQDLAGKHYGSDVRIRYANPVPADRAVDLAEQGQDLQHGVRTINEVRAIRGLEAVPWGDVPYLPAGMLPIGTAPSDEGQGQAVAVIDVQGKRGVPARVRRKIYADFREHKLALRTRLQRVMRRYFSGLQKEVLDAWDAAGREQAVVGKVMQAARVPANVDQILDPNAMAAKLAETAEPVNRWGITLGGSFEKGLTANPSAYRWDEGLASIKKYMAGYGPDHYLDVATTTRLQLMETVAEGVSNNETWLELRTRIVGEFGRMKESRAASIATTETTKLYGAGGQAFRDEYEIAYKQWIASGVNTRDTHADADGQVVRNDQAFSVGGDSMQFPGDGMLAEENCNCFIDPKTPVLTDLGPMPIGKVRPGDRVLTHKGRFRPVVRTLAPRTYHGQVVRIDTERQGKVTVTPEHAVLTDRGWIAAAKVRTGDRVTALATACAHCGKLIPQVRSGHQYDYCTAACANRANPEKAGAARVACFAKWGPGGYLAHLTVAERAKGRQVYADRYGDGDVAEAMRRLCWTALGKASWHGSAIERSMAGYLDGLGTHYQRQFRVGRRRVDFYVAEQRLFIECDSPAFHSDMKAERARDLEILLKHPDHKIAHVHYGEKPPRWELIDLAALNDAHAYQFAGARVTRTRRWTLGIGRRLYNLAVQDDESYVANGLVVHNCNCAAIGVAKPQV